MRALVSLKAVLRSFKRESYNRNLPGSAPDQGGDNCVLIISTQRHSISVGLLTLSFRYVIREDEFYVLLNFGGHIR